MFGNFGMGINFGNMNLTSEAIDKKLNDPNTKIEDLLREEELLQEFRSQNQKLIEYFGNKLKSLIPDEFRALMCVNNIVYKANTQRSAPNLAISDRIKNIDEILNDPNFIASSKLSIIIPKSSQVLPPSYEIELHNFLLYLISGLSEDRFPIALYELIIS